MTPDAKFRPEHAVLASLIEHVLRWRSGSLRVPDLAEVSGFSRFHLTRRFQSATGETLEGFLRRVRLERAAFCLQTSGHSVVDIAMECGYISPEAFTRAFKTAFGQTPTAFRQRGDLTWHLFSPTDLHWNCHWGSEESKQMAGFVESSVVYCPPRTVAVWRLVGNYAHLAKGWERLAERFPTVIPADAKFITIYHDNMWTHPTANSMRADIGWEIPFGHPAPDGMRIATIVAGRYAVTCRHLAREERNDAWSYMSGKWGNDLRLRRRTCSYDEYPSWPLPFEKARTRIFVGLAPL